MSSRIKAVFVSTVAVVTIFPVMARAGDPSESMFQLDAASAWQAAQRQNRPMLVFITMDACLHCRKMERHTFQHAEVKADIRRNFVATLVKPSDRLPLLQRLDVRSYPTTAIIAPSGRVLAKMRGYIDADRFRVRLERSLQGINTAAKP